MFKWKMLGLDPEVLWAFKKALQTVVLAIIVGKLVGGPVLVAVTFMGAQFAAKKKAGWAVACGLMIPFLTNLTNQLVSHSGGFGMLNKVCIFAMLLILMPLATGGERWKKTMPFMMLYVYLAIAAVSSAHGWCPVVSYLKIVLFGSFLLCCSVMASAMQRSDLDLIQVRAIFLVVAVVFICGSAVTLFLPGIGYSMYQNLSVTGDLKDVGMLLFSGVAFHSQALAPIVACVNAWVLCDMLFVQRRLTRLHMVMLGLALVLLYKTHSRTGFVAYSISSAIILLVAMPKAKIPFWLKRRMTSLSYGLAALLLVVGLIVEVRDHKVTAWLRKVDEAAVETDERGLMEAVTASRKGSNEMNLRDFNQNRILGMGFQTMEWHAAAYRAGQLSIWSAPIEKGVMPLMILGETGIVGAVVFVLFLFHFYGTCFAKRYTALMSTFTAVLASNIGEATFFSTTATGGIILMTSLVGGFCIDLIAERRMEVPFQFWGPR